MSEDPLKLIEKHLEKSVGDIGIQVYHKSISKLNTANPSRNEIENLISDLEKTITPLYGNDKSKAIFDQLRKKLIEDDRSFESKVKETLDNFFETKGIPDESEINDIAKYLISIGHKDERQLIEKLKQFSKERIISALNGSIINNEVRSFLGRYSAYTQVDVGDFINYMKVKKLDVNDEEVKNKIEKERLFRKFSDMEREEDQEEKIARQCIALFNSGKENNYKYILASDGNLIELVKKFMGKTDLEDVPVEPGRMNNILIK